MEPFSHQAFLYADDEEYLAGTIPFVLQGVERGEPVLVALPVARLDVLRPHLAHVAGDGLRFATMEDIGRNPAWIIPAWTDFVAPHAAAGRAVRGIGEPVWAARTADELVECARHEALLNLAFADTAGFTLLCPYDTSVLDTAVLHEAHRNHPHICHTGEMSSSDHYQPEIPPLLDSTLPPIPDGTEMLEFGAATLSPIRSLTAARAAEAGLSEARVADLVVALSEAMTNTVRHAGGTGTLALWREGDRFLCEVRDPGRITDPLAGRVRPDPLQADGRGVWLMNQLCDLVQLRALPDGQAVRLHMAG